jgi:hypothetical protein
MTLSYYDNGVLVQVPLDLVNGTYQIDLRSQWKKQEVSWIFLAARLAVLRWQDAREQERINAESEQEFSRIMELARKRRKEKDAGL